MNENNRTEKQSIGTMRDISAKTNTELLNEIDDMLETSAAEDLDVEKIEAYLAAMQERAPVTEDYDADKAWADMAAKYPAIDRVEDGESPEDDRHRARGRRVRKWLRTIEIVAAVLTAFVLTASAFGRNPIQSFLKWAGDVVQVFSNPSGILELPEDSAEEYHSLREALDANGAEDALCPTWIPKDYAISNSTVKTADYMMKISCYYASARGNLTIRITLVDDADIASTVERAEEDEQIVLIGDKEYVLLTNADYVKARWNDNRYSYVIYGQITYEELEEIIKSTEKSR